MNKKFLLLTIIFLAKFAGCNDLNQKEFKSIEEFKKYINMEKSNYSNNYYIKSLLFQKNIANQFPIHKAIQENKIDFIEVMLSQDPLTTFKLLTQKDSHHNTILHHAIINNTTETLKVILKYYFELEIQNNLNIEYQMNGDDLVNNIENSIINLNYFEVDPIGLIFLAKNKNNESPLDLILKSKDHQMLTALLSNNQLFANYILNKKIFKGKTLSERALELDSDKYIYGIWLFQHRKYKNIEQIISSKDNNGDSLPHIALKNNKSRILKLILNIINHLKLKNVLNIKDNNNKTILDIAKENKLDNLIKRIEETQLNISK